MAGFLLLVLVGGAGLYLMSGVKQKFTITTPVKRADIEEDVLASGTLEPEQLVEVGAQASGRIVKLYVGLGDRVKKGQVIAKINPAPQINTLRDAQARLAQQRAQRLSQLATLKQYEQALRRQTVTLAAEASSQADYDTARASLDATRAAVVALDAQIEQAQVAVDTAKVNLGFTDIIAPIDGIVIAVVAKEGQTVNAVQSAPTIVKIGNLDVMTVKAEISEADVIRVRPGQQVYFTILGAPQRRIYGTLRVIEPAPTSMSGGSGQTAGGTSGSSTTSSSSGTAIYYYGRFEVANPTGELRTSMTAQVNIVLARAKNTLVIPETALGARAADGRYAVRVKTADDTIETRRVRIGINNTVQAQILSGLNEGEQVIVGEAASAVSEMASFPPPPN